jgi:chemotaxis protein histidine kinase CheA
MWQEINRGTDVDVDPDELWQFAADTRISLVELEHLVGSDHRDWQEILRIFHSIKGDATFVQVRALRDLGHRIEEKLDTVSSSDEDSLAVEVIEAIADSRRILDGLPLKPPRPFAMRTVVRVDGDRLEKVANAVKMVRALEPTEPLIIELCDAIEELHLEPVEALWPRVHRIARDAASELGKKIDVQVEGTGEMDRRAIDTLREAVTHLVRNAADHGIRESGTLKVSAHAHDGRVVLSIRDDGKGISEEELLHIFESGYSTTEQPTHLSGRGVGLDIVKRKVEHEGGNIRVASRIGEGTTFTISLNTRTGV